MAERKVLNKYVPPNFDPEKIPRGKGPKNRQHKVRLMAPFSMRCNTCGEYIYKGKKFNARKENTREWYLSIRIFRFYIKCPMCAVEISFKTDPKNIDYVAETGATRNFEPWREEKLMREELKKVREKEEEYNPMKALENRTEESKREIDILEALDEIRTMNARHERVQIDEAIASVSNKVTSEELEALLKAQIEEEEDEDIIQQVFGKRSIEETEDKYVIRLPDPESNPEIEKPVESVEEAPKPKKKNNNMNLIVKPKVKSTKANTSNPLSLVSSYGDDDE